MVTILSSCGFQKETVQPEKVSEVQSKTEQPVDTQGWVARVETGITSSVYSEANPLILWSGFLKTKLYVKNGKLYSFIVNDEEGVIGDWNDDFKAIWQDGYFSMWGNLYFAANANHTPITTIKSDSKYELYHCVNGIDIDWTFFVTGKKQDVQFSGKASCFNSDFISTLYDDSGVYILEIPSSGKMKYFAGIDGKSLKSISENLVWDGKWNKLRSICGPGGCEYSNETTWAAVTSFSDSQIKDILVKIDENTKKQQEIANSATWTLIQGEFKAEYIIPSDYGKETDNIVINIPSWKYEFSGVYGKEEMGKYLNAIKEWRCKVEKWQNVDSVLVNGVPHERPASWDCLMQKDFGHFLNFSPSGNYLLYSISGWEYEWALLVDSKTGKTVIKVDYPEFSIWTLDRKQFIYAGGAVMGWCKDGCWLHITLKNSFPKDKILTADFVSGWYIDETRLYVKTYNYTTNKETFFLKIYDLNTLDEIFSKEIGK